MKYAENTYGIPTTIWRSKHYFAVITDQEGKILNKNDAYKTYLSRPTSNIYDDLVESDKVMLTVSLNKLKPLTNRSLTLRTVLDKKILLTSWEFSYDESEGYVIFIGQDVTKSFQTKVELEKTTSKLFSQNELFKVLMGKNKAGFWYWDLENNKQKLSPEIKQMLQYDGLEEKFTWQSRIGKKELKKTKDNLKEHFTSMGEIPFYQEIKNTLPDGSSLWVICFGKVVKWKNGKPFRMRGCFIDITKTKATEEIILKQNESLEKISFSQSHLMRAKVANIIGLLNILDEKIMREENKDFYKLIKKETEKLDKIIRKNVSDSKIISYDLTRIFIPH